MSADPKELHLPPPAGAPVAEHHALPPGTCFGEFEILRVIGFGGFGIVYLAQDHSLERRVALKEYMPASLAARGEGPLITVRSGSSAETYAIGLRSFINEARLLARFDHPSLVKVYRFWEDNATAYMVMPYLQGITLRDARRAMPGPPDEAWIRSVVDPVLDALELLHRQGVYHRDVAPDNIMLPSEGPPILLDFGAARRVISGRTHALTAILKPSYAPIEQYAEMTALRQGPWTDLYALGAVVHFLLFGTPPEPATARLVSRDADRIARREVPGVSPRLIETVAWMLGVRPEDRPQDVATVRAALNGVIPVPVPAVGEATSGGATVALATAIPAAAVAAPTFAPTAQAPESVDDPDATRVLPVLAASRGAGSPKASSAPGRRPADAAWAPTERAMPAEAAPPPSSQVAPPALRDLPPRQGPPPIASPAPSRATADQPAAPRSTRSPLFIAGLVLALLIAGVVLWQFIELLGRPPGAGVALAPAPAASVALVPPAGSRVGASVVLSPPAGAAASAVAAAPPVAASSSVTTASSPVPVGSVTADPSGAPAATGPFSNGVAVSTSISTDSAASATRGLDEARLAPKPAASGPTRAARLAAARAARESASAAPPIAAAVAVPAENRSTPIEPPAARPAPVAPAAPATAREACGGREFLSLAVCMERECESPRYRVNPDCTRVLEIKHAREQRYQ